MRRALGYTAVGSGLAVLADWANVVALALLFYAMVVVSIELIRHYRRGMTLSRAVVYLWVGVVLSALAFVSGPTLMGIPQPGPNSDPDGSVTRFLDALPVLGLTLIAYVVVVSSLEVSRRHRQP